MSYSGIDHCGMDGLRRQQEEPSFSSWSPSMIIISGCALTSHRGPQYPHKIIAILIPITGLATRSTNSSHVSIVSEL